MTKFFSHNQPTRVENEMDIYLWKIMIIMETQYKNQSIDISPSEKIDCRLWH